MAVITGGRVSRMLQKFLGIKGELVVPDLGPELHAVLPVLDLPTELRILDGWRSYAAGALSSAIAAQNSSNGFINPVGSGVVAVIERWWAFELVTLENTIGLFRGALVAGSKGLSRDSRSRSGGTVSLVDSVCTVNSANNQGGGTTFGQFPLDFVTAAAIATFPIVYGRRDEIVVMPGECIEVRTGVLNMQVGSQIWWRERALEPSEVTA